ncbi:hypothetical protein [Collimonas sp.]|uniref:hypothetical protein n=1 Tax=Collimonas sp. TaxID=1963772 RepID=UPI0037BF5821
MRNGDVKLSRMVPQKAFPAKLLNEPPPTEEPLAWPALSTIRVYREPPNQLFSSEDRSFDLSDVLTHNLSANEIGIAYVGVLTQNTAWEIWDERALRRIEERIGYLFRFDSFGIEIERVTTESNTWCTDEFVWKIKFWSDFGALDTLNDDSVASMLATDDFQS